VTASGDGSRRRTARRGLCAAARGTYRIDAVRRKVYLRGDLAMFCGDAHREQAEAIGVSLAISLEAQSEASEKAGKGEGTGVEPRNRRRAERFLSGVFREK
jgi:hypothetical protein